MSKKDDKHLRLIEECRWLAQSSDSLKLYQTKITKLANSLNKDILQERVRDLFTIEEIQSIEQAAIALSRFKNTVAHAKEYQAREEKRLEAAFQDQFRLAQILIEQKYTFNENDYLGKLRFALAAQHADGFATDLDYELLSLERRLSMLESSALQSFPQWADNSYKEGVRLCVNMILNYGDESLDENRIELVFSRIDKSLSMVDIKAKKQLDAAAWYLAKLAGGLTEAEKKALGIQS